MTDDSAFKKQVRARMAETGEKYTVARRMVDTAEDAERWWDAYQLAEGDQAGELRERAEAGDEHARRQLASWLADRGYVNGGLNDPAGLNEAIEVIRPLAEAGHRAGRAGS